MKLRYHYRKLTHPQSKLLLETAYHEAGHVCFSYFSGFQVTEVSVDIKRPGNGRTNPLYNEHSNVVNVLFGQINIYHLFSNLSHTEKSTIKGVTHRLVHSILAGPIAEARFKALSNQAGYGNVILQHSDYLMCHTVINGLNSILVQHNIQTFPNTYLQSEILSLNQIMTLELIWKAISEIAKAILNKKSLSLNQIEIENILNKVDFFNYINENSN